MMLKHKKTAHTEAFIGLRKRSDRKMEVSKENHGRLLRVILVTGAIIAKKVSESNIVKMVTSMRACGLLTRDTVRELIGEQKAVNSGESILEIGLKIKSTAEAHFSTKIKIDMMVIG